MTRLRFENKRALITGAASGIGLETARLFASEGADLVLVDRDRERLESVRGDFVGHEIIVCDQTDERGLGLLGEAVTERPVDVCFANAGYGAYGSFLETDISSLRRHLDVNVVGTAAVVQIAARGMIEAGRPGSIVLTASTAALYPPALFSHYAASKAAGLMLMRSLAAELGPHGIRINAVLPGVTETRMTAGILSDERSYRWVERETPLARLAGPTDIAATVAFLASDESAYVTGEGILVDGGQTINGFPRWFARDASQPDGEWQLYPDYLAAVEA